MRQVWRLAAAIDVSRQSVNELLRERRAVSLDVALRLARLFGNTPEFWMNAQRDVDLWDTAEAIKSAACPAGGTEHGLKIAARANAA